MCGDCSVLPPGEEDPEAAGGSRDIARMAAVCVAAFSGGLVGAALWSLAGARAGFAAWGAVLPAVGARLGVRIARGEMARTVWPVTAVAALGGVFAALWFNAYYMVGALYAKGAAAIPANIREVFGNDPPTSLLDGRVLAVVVGTIVASSGMVAASVAIALVAALLGPRGKRF